MPQAQQPLTRRGFIRTLAAAPAAFAFAPSLLRAQEAGETSTISVFHTTDLHGNILPTADYDGTADLGGLARVATQLARWRAESPNHVLVDVGDLYQGTPEGYATRGRVVVDCLNALRYDAWVVGNHEFDWGPDVLAQAIGRSRMPVLAANARVEPAASKEFPLAPFFIKNVAGFRLAVVGVTTPGMPYWLSRGLLGPIEVTDPVAALRAALLEVRAQGADVIVLAAHMGHRERGDDFANRIDELAQEFPQIAVILGGHTHRAVPVRVVRTVLYTQADHYGIHAGRVDILMDKRTRKPLAVTPVLARMDAAIKLDPEILSLTAPAVEEASREMGVEVGKLAVRLEVDTDIGRPSGEQRLHAAAFRRALAARGEKVDAVLHGGFLRSAIEPGTKTIADVWRIAPFENQIVTAELTRAELEGVMQEVITGGRGDDVRNLVGMEVRTVTEKNTRRVTEVRLGNGAPLEAGRRYKIAVNSYDAQSAGRRLLLLRALLELNSSRCRTHPLQAREALIALFRDAGSVGEAELAWPAA